MKKIKEIFRFAVPFIKKQKKYLILLMIVAFLSSLISAVEPNIFGCIIDESGKENIDNIKTSTSNGYTIISNADWLQVKPLIKSIAAMKTESAELIKMLKEFENTNTAKENQDLRSQAEQLAKENQVLEKELEKVKQFMEETEVGSGLTVMDLYTMNREAEKEKVRQDNRDFSGYYADRE